MKHILENEGQKSAHYAFKDIYQDYLVRAQKKGKTQEMWVKPKKTHKLTHDRKTVQCPAHLMKQVKGLNKLSKGDAA